MKSTSLWGFVIGARTRRSRLRGDIIEAKNNVNWKMYAQSRKAK
jgi:hypothetical protein